jgi:2Fe-2S ferredoxin
VVEVTVEPGHLSLSLQTEESLLDGALRIGWRWPTICQGNAECLVCWVEVVEGMENAVPAEPSEIAALELLAKRQSPLSRLPVCTRLACQLRFTGNATVKRAGLNL